jgi:subtilisin
MRRIVATAAAAALLLSSVGGATAAEPAATPATVVAPPTPSVDPLPSAELVPSAEPVAAEPAASGPAADDPSPSDDPPVEPEATTPAPVIVTPAGPRPTASENAGTHSKPGAATDPTGRWIVVLRAGTDPAVASSRQGKRLGFISDRTFKHALRGYSAKLDAEQVEALRHDSAVQLIVADERIEAEAQTIPTGILRIGTRSSATAKLDGLDQRVDADVAIVDTGIALNADLNVAGGYNCSTSNRALWRDVQGHGTHVAGTVGAIDNGAGVVGVAPGVRLWAVKILDDTGSGLLSWYVCGLDWIAAQRDPSDPTRPRFESVNMSVAKWGKDDANCGKSNSDILHQAICRLVASGVTVVAAAANDSGSASARVPAAYNEVITVSALADTDGKPGGLGGRRCYSWGTYDVDDTFASFSNYGSDVDLIAPGKCIWSTVPGGYKYSSGTSMAAPHVAGAAALLKSNRPGLTPAEVRQALQYLGSTNWRTSTDPDSVHEKLLDVSRIGPRGDFSVAVGPTVILGEAGGVATFPVSITRTSTSFERIRLSATGLPAGATASFSTISSFGFGPASSTLTVTIPLGIATGSYPITITADEHGNTHTATAKISIEGDPPVAAPPSVGAQAKATLGTTLIPTRVTWPAAQDATTAIGAYELETSIDGGAWTPTTTTAGTIRTTTTSQTVGHAYRYRIRARDIVGNWSDWVAGTTATGSIVQDRSTAVVYSGTWTRNAYVSASGGTTTYATSSGARSRLAFSGRGIALVAPLGPTRGSATIYVDGVSRGSLSFRASTGRSRVVMFATTFPSVASHTIEVRLNGTGRVDVDAFVVFR